MKRSESVFDRCVVAYSRHCGRHQGDRPGMCRFQQPSRYDSDWENDKVDGFSVSLIK
jgi:hypothetical protein